MKGLRTGASESGREGNWKVLCGRSAWERNHAVWECTSFSSSTRVKEADTFVSSIAYGFAPGRVEHGNLAHRAVQCCPSADFLAVKSQVVCDVPRGPYELEGP
jgi:hypothetical protein